MIMLDNLQKYNIILASGSPRRKELLEGLGLQFSVEVVKGIEETYPADLPVEEIPVYLSRLKATAYEAKDNDLIITADTVVVLGSEVIGKPHDEAEAKHMLAQLSGNTHKVITGVTISSAQRVESFGCTSEVEFAALTAEEIDYYVKNFRPFDKAGSYGIQEWIGYMGIKGIKGSFYNVMGLPVQRLYAMLKTF